MQGGHDRAARAEKEKNVLVVDEDPRANPTSCSVVTDSRSSRVQMHGGEVQSQPFTRSSRSQPR
jgi:hypothetical protein